MRLMEERFCEYFHIKLLTKISIVLRKMYLSGNLWEGWKFPFSEIMKIERRLKLSDVQATSIYLFLGMENWVKYVLCNFNRKFTQQIKSFRHNNFN